MVADEAHEPGAPSAAEPMEASEAVAEPMEASEAVAEPMEASEMAAEPMEAAEAVAERMVASAVATAVGQLDAEADALLAEIRAWHEALSKRGSAGWNERTPFAGLFDAGPDGRPPAGDYTNAELWALFDPLGDDMQYVYDQYTSWGDREWDPWRR